MLRFARRVSLLAFLLWVVAVPTFADPITVTGGSAFMWWDGSGGNATLRGNGLSVSTDTFNGGLVGFAAGQVNLDGGVTFGTLGGQQHTWHVTVDGTEYVSYLDGSLSFATTPFHVSAPEAGAPNATFATPFTMTGRLRGTTGASGTGSVLFDIVLTGNGIASTVARPVTGFGYLVNAGVTYEFAAAPAATPEPATLLLMGTGLAGVLLRRRRANERRP